MSEGHEHHEEEFAGPATLVAQDAEVTAQVRLRGFFQPIDGRFHWYGRVSADPAVVELAGKGMRKILVRTAGGEAEAVLSEPDTWGRYRITGVGRPPFPVETDIPDGAE
ncbi:DUF4873 domain-containing protein [Longimycelium tulufanense]|uniref:DUF4873 domain-containing protein n=1 Tax=Longimycelium tulufanense TaxID=907463 RepID=A0A8J3C6P1_9PSEU|nr:DUF4873 domain-containing protein [Longimycelium tulufanense]GGM42408.1 DUF4873 domain-containing protein [Longimycelium tulufanense]